MTVFKGILDSWSNLSQAVLKPLFSWQPGSDQDKMSNFLLLGSGAYEPTIAPDLMYPDESLREYSTWRANRLETVVKTASGGIVIPDTYRDAADNLVRYGPFNAAIMDTIVDEGGGDKDGGGDGDGNGDRDGDGDGGKKNVVLVAGEQPNVYNTTTTTNNYYTENYYTENTYAEKEASAASASEGLFGGGMGMMLLMMLMMSGVGMLGGGQQQPAPTQKPQYYPQYYG